MRSASNQQPPQIQLRPLTPAELDSSVERAVHRHAADYARRGIWNEADAVDASRRGFAELLRSGSEQRSRHFAQIVEASSGKAIGETWYVIETEGGRTHVWIDWLWIEPAQRRHGFGAATLRELEAIAVRFGASSASLSVWLDNPDAIALYTREGYVAFRTHMRKTLR